MNSDVNQDMNPSALRNLSLAGFQGWNNTVFGIQNDRHYDRITMVLCILKYASRLLKGDRLGHINQSSWILCNSFSWSLAIANKLHITLEDEMWKMYPGSCPHCIGSVCICSPFGHHVDVVVPAEPVVVCPPNKLANFQLMLAHIYQKNELDTSIKHLAEEMGPLACAMTHFVGTNKAEHLERVRHYLVKVVANILAFATCLKLDLAREMERNFPDGCPRCHCTPCKDCGFNEDI